MIYTGRSTLGIDIGTSAIKVVEVSNQSSRKIKSLGLSILPSGVIENGVFIDPKVIREHLIKTLKSMGVSPRWKKAVISVNAANTVLRRVFMPNRDDDTMEDMAEQEADQHVQMSFDDSYLSWHIYDALPDQSDRSVLFAGCAHELVDSRIQLIKGLHMTPKVIDCDVLSIANLYEFLFPKSRELVCLLDMGASATTMILLANGEYQYSRTLPYGGRHFTSHIANTLQIDLTSAEITKIAAANNDQAALNQITHPLQQMLEAFVKELQVSANYFFQNQENKVPDAQIKSIFITGAASRTPGVKSLITQRICTQTDYLNALSYLPKVASLADDKQSSTSEIFSVATGLALRDDID
ncbi:MAG: type IV pilus assembly protein PilM [Zetaproteobacteria bacterium]|nr:type IV pilus assembly protein PilM [Zetaproteobacteria bacterium]